MQKRHSTLKSKINRQKHVNKRERPKDKQQFANHNMETKIWALGTVPKSGDEFMQSGRLVKVQRFLLNR